MENEQSLVAIWNEVMLDAIRTGGASPTPTTYQLHLVSAAIYDAWAALDDTAHGHYSEIETPLAATPAVKAEAISFAAHRMLSAVLPDSQDRFDAMMAELGYDIAEVGTDPASAAGLGNLAAQNVLAARAGDGSNVENGFADASGYVPANSPEPGSPAAPGGAEFDPNAWQPLRVPTGTLTDADGIPVFDNDDPASFSDQVPLTPHWGSVAAFALEDPDAVLPPPPPQLGDFTPYTDAQGNTDTNDAAYRAQAAEVLDISASLTTEQKVIAEYWADGPRTESPPGHWNQIAQDIALREGHGIDEDAKLFFALNAAVFDAGIATWHMKYVYDYVRPQSAIRHLYYGDEVSAWAGPNRGTQTIPGEDWQPYQNVTFVTPPFPEYGSGHSAFSMAAARTIAAFVGSDAFYDGQTLGAYDLDDIEGIDLLGQYVATELAFEEFPQGEDAIILQWETLTDAALEAGISRLYGGIHFRDGNERALELGATVAEIAQARWEALFTMGGDDSVAGAGEGGAVLLGAGDDRFTGASAAVDDVEGGSGDDWIAAGGGDDRIHGGPGDDILDGGAGRDTAIYGGGAGDYLLTFDAATGALAVHDKRTAGDGRDALSSIERLEFADGYGFGAETALDLTLIAGAAGLPQGALLPLVELYIGYLDRAPDALGLLYWGTVLAQGATLGQIARGFHDQDETQASLPLGATAGSLVDALYGRLFGRDADAEGRAYWVAAIESGDVAVAELPLALINGAKAATGSETDARVLADKVGVGVSYAIDAGLNDPDAAAASLAAYDPADAADSLASASALVAAYRADAQAPGHDDIVVQLTGWAGPSSVPLDMP